MNRILRIFFKIITGIVLIIFTGCSINNYGIKGLLDQQEGVTPCAKIISTKAKGIYFYTTPAVGIQIGYMERDLIYPVITGEPDYCIKRLLLSSQLEPDLTKIVYSEKPVLMETKRIGLGMELSPYSFTGNIGVSRNKRMRIKADSSFTMFYLNSNENKNKDICVTVNE